MLRIRFYQRSWQTPGFRKTSRLMVIGFTMILTISPGRRKKENDRKDFAAKRKSFSADCNRFDAKNDFKYVKR